MKKCIAFIAMVAIFFGITATTVSAQKYEVEKGDNLWNIAQEHETTVEDLVEMNELETTIIQPSQELIIDDIYEVKKKDTLISVSEEFDVPVDELKELNDIKYSWITPGQELKLYDVTRISEDKKETSKEVSREAKQEESTTEKPEKKVEQASQAPEKPDKPEGKTMEVTATAYTAQCDGCSGITYTGVDLNKDRNAKVIAVDPSVIPLGSEVYVEGYGYAKAEDIGGAIKGNIIDLHVPTKEEAYNWGRRTVSITILN